MFMPINALSVLCAQLTRDLLAIAKFLYYDGQYALRHRKVRFLWAVVVALFATSPERLQSVTESIGHYIPHSVLLFRSH